jgi:hypothetical protein
MLEPSCAGFWQPADSFSTDLHCPTAGGVCSYEACAMLEPSCAGFWQPADSFSTDLHCPTAGGVCSYEACAMLEPSCAGFWQPADSFSTDLHCPTAGGVCSYEACAMLEPSCAGFWQPANGFILPHFRYTIMVTSARTTATCAHGYAPSPIHTSTTTVAVAFSPHGFAPDRALHFLEDRIPDPACFESRRLGEGLRG